jgi:uncharacterized repeat protein (TIGR01451 family)
LVVRLGGRLVLRRSVAVGVALALIALTAGVVGVTTASAATQNCDYADPGTGTFARTICWFDLTAYNAAQATSPAGQAFTEALPGGFSISFTLNVTGTAVKATSLPTYSGAFFGNNGHYTGIAHKPALYQTGSGTTTAALTNISVVDSGGNVAKGFALVGADAESTDAGESITWTSDKVLQSLTQTPAGNGLGNACNGGFTGVGTTTVKCSAVSSNTKTGSPILAAENPTAFAQKMVGGGLEAIAFGVLVSKVELTKTVVNKYAGDDFRVDITDSDNKVIGTDSTGGGSTADTGEITVLTGLGSASYTLSETATSGALSNYQGSWSCTRNGATDPSLPSGDAGASASVVEDVGDIVDCTITNTAIPSSLLLTKQAGTPVDVNGDGITDAGDTIGYTFTVNNAGQLPIDSIAVSDAKAGSVTCQATTLAPGDSTTCVADNPYVVTTADESAGTVHNSATASGIPTGETATVTSPAAVTDTPAAAPAPAIKLTKKATVNDVDGDFRIDLGDTVAWTFVIENTGNLAVTDPTVSDPTAGNVTCPSGTLAPGDQITCTADALHTITQDDVDAGVVSNTATASVTDPFGNAVPSNSSSTATPIAQTPKLTLVKQATTVDSNADGVTDLGDTIDWRFLLTNSGTVKLIGIGVVDTKAGAVSCPQTTLGRGAFMTCTAAPYTITQDDVDAGVVNNTATAAGQTAGGTAVASGPSSTSTTVAQTSSLQLTKTASVSDVDSDGTTDLGDTITWTLLATNTGTTTLHTVSATDATAGAVSCPSGSLAPGATTSCTTAAHTITQADVDLGHVDNTATGHALNPADATVDSNPASVTTPVSSTRGLLLAKHAALSDTSGDGHDGIGDTVTWTFDLTNTGTQTLDAVNVVDNIAGPASCQTTTLAPGDSTTCAADSPHTVTQVDVDTGFVTNTATAGATAPGGTSVTSNASSTDTPLDQTAALRLTKHGHANDTNADGRTDPGDTITWTFTATNIGLVTLTHVAVTDTKAGHVTCLNTTLAPAESTTCTADTPYRITGADGDAGAIHNSATADARCNCSADVLAAQAAAVVPAKASPRHVAGTTTSAGNLPFTGAAALPWTVGGGIIALITGALLLVMGRRRRA